MSQAGISGTMGGGGRIVTTINTFNPNATLQEFDDFISSFSGSSLQSKLIWTVVGSDIGQLNGTADHPGIWKLGPTAGTNIAFFLSQDTLGGASASIAPILLGGGTVTLNWNLQLSSLSAGGNSYRFSAGLANTSTLNSNLDTFVDGVYFQYTHSVNGGNWQIKSTSASVTTTANTTTAASTSFVTLSIVINAAASSVSYYINGTQVANSPITTNIPIAAITPFIEVVNTAGTTPPINIDLFWITINLTNTRPGIATSSTIVGTGMLIEQYKQTGVNYQVLATDAIIGCSAGGITITLPLAPAATGQVFTIKDESGTAAASNITVSGNGKTIDGAATFVINTNFGAISLYYNGTNFFIM